MNLKMEQMPTAVARYLSYLISIRGSSERTAYEYSLDLAAFFRYVFRARANEDGEVDLSVITDSEIGQISTHQIYEYLLYAANNKKNKSAARARKLSAIKGFYKFLAVKEKCISNNPAKDVDAPAVKKALPKYLDVTECHMLLEAVNRSGAQHRKRDLAILTLFLNCGMRVSELAGISLGDLARDLGSVVVTGKGNKQRVVYLNAACKSALSDYLEERKALTCKDPNALFVSRNSQRLSVKTLQWLVYKYLKEAGLDGKHYSVHKLRHTAATLLYGTGKVDVRVLKDILGHEQLNTTQIYTHLSDDQMKNAMEENPLNS